MMERFPYETALLWIVLLPFAGAAINGLFGRKADRSLVTAVGVGTVAGSFVLASIAFARIASRLGGGAADVRIVNDVYEWVRVGSFSVDVAFSMDALSGVMAVMVTGIALLIHVYSASYMAHDEGFARYFAYLNLFTGSMLVLVLAKSFPILFVGWEGVGLCSYLLIGFWFGNGAYADAAKKAFIVNRIGDLGVLLGMFVLVGIAHSFDFDAINAVAGALNMQPLAWGIGVSAATGAALLLFLGCAGKSAQLPLYVWLPDAMAGPTPVSALIHAATMVTAGVYLCARLAPVFQASPVALAVIAVVGATTAFLAATIAVAQNDLKKILAYSTVSQLGFMFTAVGAAAPIAGMFHVFTHAFFKACLFLGAGSVMHAVHVHGDADIRKLGGLRKYLPITHLTFLVSCLSIAGFPLLAGFYSKDAILEGVAKVALSHDGEFGAIPTFLKYAGVYALVMLAISATLTAFYMFRLYFLTFAGEYRGAGTYDAHPHEGSKAITIPLLILMVGAIFAGYLGVPEWMPLPNRFVSWLGPVVSRTADVTEHAEHAPMWIALVVGLSAAGLGIFGAWALYSRGQEDVLPNELPPKLYAFLADKWRVDELYDAVLVRPMKAISSFLAMVDRAFVDVVFTRLPALAAEGIGFAFSRAQDGVVHTYGLVMTIGLGGVLGFFLYPHVTIEAKNLPDGSVELRTAKGFGYRYRWDANSDGTFEGALSPTSTTTMYRYGTADHLGIALVVVDASGVRGSEIELEGRPMMLDETQLGPHWRDDSDDSLAPPVVWRVPEGLVVRPNGHLAQGGLDVAGRPGERLVPAGTSLRLGTVRLEAAPIVGATVEVENLFGNRVKRTSRFVLEQDARAAGRAAHR